MTTTTKMTTVGEQRKVLKLLHYPLELMLVCTRWYVAYPLSFRHFGEIMKESGGFVDHVTVQRWSLKILPILALIFRTKKRPVDNSWRLDEAYIKVADQLKYLYRAADKVGDTVDFLLIAKRDLASAGRYLGRAIELNGLPQHVTIDKNSANTDAIRSVNQHIFLGIELRQSKYLNAIIKQVHRTVKKSRARCWASSHFGVIRKEELHCTDKQSMSAADHFTDIATDPPRTFEAVTPYVVMGLIMLSVVCWIPSVATWLPALIG